MSAWKIKSLYGLVITLLVILFTTIPSSAAINPQINFQGKITNPDGTNIANGSYTIRFRLYNDPTLDASNACSANTCKWEESKSITTTDGNFQTALGDTTALPGSVDFNTATIYLGVKVGADSEMTPRVRFTASPYAFNADKVGGLSVSSLVQLSPGAQQTGTINVSGSITTSAAAFIQGAATIGSTSAIGQIKFLDGTADGFTGTLQLTGALAASQTYNLPATGGTLCLSTNNCSYIQNQNSAQQAASSFWLSGSGRADTSMLTPLLDVASPGTLSIGTSTASALTVSKAGVTTTVAGALAVTQASTVTGLQTDNGGLTVVGATAINTSNTFSTNIGNSTGTFALTSSGLNISTVGALSGVTTLSLNGAITGATTVNTINGLIISSGSLTGVTGITNSGSYTQTGASLNTFTGDATFTGAATGLTVNNNALISGNLVVSGTSTFNGITAVKPASNSSAFSVQTAGGSSLLNVDSVNNNISLNAINSGQLAPFATNTNALPSGRNHMGEAYYNGYIYLVGGTDGTLAFNTVWYAKVNSDGSTGSWQTSASTLPQQLTSGNAVAVNGYLYYIGGSLASTVQQSTVYVAKINTDGTLGPFSSTTPLPVASDQAGATAYKGYIYYLGGGTNTAAVYYTKVAPDGTLGAWTLSANSLPATVYQNSAIVANGYLYSVGGINGAGTALLATVNYAKLNADGSTSAFAASANALPIPLRAGTVGIANGYLYYLGGANATGASAQSAVYYGKISATGGIASAFVTNTNALPAIRNYATSEVINGYVYELGGSDGTVYQPTVYYASTSRVSVNGALDLVGTSGTNLTEGGTGGMLTAGNSSIVGTLNVQDAVSLNSTLNVSGVTNLVGNTVIGDGFSTTDTNMVTLTLDSTTTLNEAGGTCSATVNNGALYYNSNPGVMAVRGCINGSWEDLVSTAGAFFAFFGVVPDSGNNPGDLQSLATAGVTGPCKVSRVSATQVGVQPCIAYSGDHKVTVSSQTLTIAPVNGNFFHVCLSGTNNQPVVSTGSATESANLSSVSLPSASNPILCLADVKTSGTQIIGIYDTRIFTTTTKEFAYSSAALPLGVMVKPSATPNLLGLPGTAATGSMRGVVVASNGAAWASGGPNIIIATGGVTSVKATAGTLSTVNTVQNSTTTSGYALTAAASATAYANLGIAQNTFSNTCSAATNCNSSLLVDIRLR